MGDRDAPGLVERLSPQHRPIGFADRGDGVDGAVNPSLAGHQLVRFLVAFCQQDQSVSQFDDVEPDHLFFRRQIHVEQFLAGQQIPREGVAVIGKHAKVSSANDPTVGARLVFARTVHRPRSPGPQFGVVNDIDQTNAIAAILIVGAIGQDVFSRGRPNRARRPRPFIQGPAVGGGERADDPHTGAYDGHASRIRHDASGRRCMRGLPQQGARDGIERHQGAATKDVRAVAHDRADEQFRRHGFGPTGRDRMADPLIAERRVVDATLADRQIRAAHRDRPSLDLAATGLQMGIQIDTQNGAAGHHHHHAAVHHTILFRRITVAGILDSDLPRVSGVATHDQRVFAG